MVGGGGKTKSDAIAKKRDGDGDGDGVIRRARDIYAKALCNCGDRRSSSSSVLNCTVPRKYDVTSKEIIDSRQDLRDLMHLLSTGKGGSAKVDVDSEGNIVWRKPSAASSYGGGVGRIGRIDEDKLCCFYEGDVFNKFIKYSRTGTGTGTGSYNNNVVFNSITNPT